MKTQSTSGVLCQGFIQDFFLPGGKLDWGRWGRNESGGKLDWGRWEVNESGGISRGPSPSIKLCNIYIYFFN